MAAVLGYLQSPPNCSAPESLLVAVGPLDDMWTRSSRTPVVDGHKLAAKKSAGDTPWCSFNPVRLPLSV